MHMYMFDYFSSRRIDEVARHLQARHDQVGGRGSQRQVLRTSALRPGLLRDRQADVQQWRLLPHKYLDGGGTQKI